MSTQPTGSLTLKEAVEIALRHPPEDVQLPVSRCKNCSKPLRMGNRRRGYCDNCAPLSFYRPPVLPVYGVRTECAKKGCENATTPGGVSRKYCESCSEIVRSRDRNRKRERMLHPELRTDGPQNCQHCGTSFIPVSPTQKSCSTRCSRASAYAMRKARGFKTVKAWKFIVEGAV